MTGQKLCHPCGAGGGQQGDSAIPDSEGRQRAGIPVDKRRKLIMEKECTERGFDYYSIRCELGDEPFRYRFMIQDQDQDQVCYYGRCGVSGEAEEFYDFEIVPGFPRRTWAKGAGHVPDLYRPVL